jgi:deoxyribodipyrimidine photolyase-related protein
LRNLVVILGDQLNADSAAFDHFDARVDAVWMAEVSHEARKVWSTKARIAIFLTAMRHFAQQLSDRGVTVHYGRVSDPHAKSTLADALADSLERLQPAAVVWVEPGEYALRGQLRAVVAARGLRLDERPDRHFMASHEQFRAHAEGRRELRMEFFYREMRRRHGVLMRDGKPEGDAWNFDAENRKGFGKAGPPSVPRGARFAPDALTAEVIADVERQFADHPGSLADFDWPVCREHALVALADFITHRLPLFGTYQDAMWTGEPFLFHARLSAALNLKLLDPREVIAAAEAAFRAGRAPLAATEGFIRQILGWREYVRGIYWQSMPEYAERNALGATAPLPRFYWSGDVDMVCLRESIGQTLRLGYAHHIQRLMVTGLFGLLLGVHPKAMHEWYLAVYVDAVEWVELPNTLGMSQYADGGVMASKPYAASGRYIERMSNYCKSCRFDPGTRTGERACPFTTLYWDFLLRHEQRLAGNRRMDLALKHLVSIGEPERRAISAAAKGWRARLRD